MIATLLAIAVGMATIHILIQKQIALHPQRFNVYPLPDKLLGLALQRQAFTDPALMPVYGSSELTQPQTNRADAFFRAQPTGFGAFLIGNPGETCLIITTKVAATNPKNVHGQKAVVFLSPSWFLAPELDHFGFGVNFSPLQGGVLTFESSLGPSLRQDLARRLLEYPDIIAKYPLLKAGLACEADKTTLNRVLKNTITPLGLVHNRVQRELDYTRLGLWLYDNSPRYTPGISDGIKHPVRIDWDARIRDATAAAKAEPLQTSYCVGPQTGFDDRQRKIFIDPRHPERTPDENFRRAFNASKEWTDYRLLLRTAQELKIDFMVICQPINANFSQLQGVGAEARAAFYQRLRAETAPFQFPLVTYSQEGEYAHYFQDAGHPTALMWLLYDRDLDNFYHRPKPTDG